MIAVYSLPLVLGEGRDWLRLFLDSLLIGC